MANLKLQEAARLSELLEDYDLGIALKVFFDTQRVYYIEKCKDSMIQMPPQHEEAVQYGAKSEAYREAFELLKDFAKRELAKH